MIEHQGSIYMIPYQDQCGLVLGMMGKALPVLQQTRNL
jgi:hypothetical protein